MSVLARTHRLHRRLSDHTRRACALCGQTHVPDALERFLDGVAVPHCSCAPCSCDDGPGPAEIVGDLARLSARVNPRRALRPYQAEAGRHITAAALGWHPGPLVLLFARQSGKDETLAQALAHVLRARRRQGGSVVVANPTWRPQSVLSLERLADRLAYAGTSAPPASRHNVIAVGAARAAFLSADPTANARGETASLLLVCNEA